MKNASAYFLAILIACFGFSRAAVAVDHSQATAVADVSAIQPGVPFTLGIKFTIDPGWHIYWKNPGDSGLATEVKLTLPDGFTAGELMFPVPHRLQLPGDIINYAYENEVMLMVSITPPKDLPAGKSVTIGAKASWLVCKDDCVPGRAEVSLELPVAAAATPANADLFDKWSKQLPLKEDPGDIGYFTDGMAIAKGEGTASINIRWKKLPTDIQYIPGPLANGDVQNVKPTTDGDSTRITFTIKNYKGDEPVTGLLTFTSATGVKTGVEVSFPVPK